MSNELITLLVAVIVGGIFGWTLGKMPDKYVYVLIAIAALLVLVLVTQADSLSGP